jgi:hypothetical protein
MQPTEGTTAMEGGSADNAWSNYLPEHMEFTNSKYRELNMELIQYPDGLTDMVIAAAIEVPKELGPGLLESVYEKALAIELTDRGINAKRQIDIATTYKACSLDEAQRNPGHQKPRIPLRFILQPYPATPGEFKHDKLRIVSLRVLRALHGLIHNG